jgi:predicted helicase
VERSQGQKVYRSRSALLLLSEQLSQPPQDEDRSLTNWFAFEEAISVLLKNSFHCGIEHRAPRGKTDDGIDILASRQNGDVREIWVVQCKCYKPSNLIGPSHVRELLGAIADINAEEGTIVKGMLVTTSRFSGDALKLALRHGIQCVSGDDLAAIFGSVNRNLHPLN